MYINLNGNIEKKTKSNQEIRTSDLDKLDKDDPKYAVLKWLYDISNLVPNVDLSKQTKLAINRFLTDDKKRPGLKLLINGQVGTLHCYRNPYNRTPNLLENDSGRHVLFSIPTKTGFDFVHIIHSGRGIKHGAGHSENILYIQWARLNEKMEHTGTSAFLCHPNLLKDHFPRLLTNIDNPNSLLVLPDGSLRIQNRIARQFGPGATTLIPYSASRLLQEAQEIYFSGNQLQLSQIPEQLNLKK